MDVNFEADLKYFESSFAFSKPICLIPNAYMNFSKDIIFF